MKSQSKSRWKALGIDVAVVLFVWMLLHIVFDHLLKTHIHYFIRHQIQLAVVFALFLCKDLVNGQSIGKRICKLRVVGDNGNEPTPWRLYLRNVFAIVFFIEAIFLLSGNKRAGDIACNTRVVPAPDEPRKATPRQIARWWAFFLGSIVAYFLLAYVLIRVIRVL